MLGALIKHLTLVFPTWFMGSTYSQQGLVGPISFSLLLFAFILLHLASQIYSLKQCPLLITIQITFQDKQSLAGTGTGA